MRPRFASIVSVLMLFLVGGAWASPLTKIYKQVRSSVVVIQTTQRDIDPAIPGQAVTVEGLGSGVLISEDGKVLTAAHVVHTADEIEVYFHSGETIPARVLSSEPTADVALIQLDRKPEGAHVATLGDSDKVEVGEEIFILGAPMGATYTLTVGHISARRDSDSLFGEMIPAEQFQTDAAINEGNSGGPMFNMHGDVIGVVSYILSQSGGSEGLGFVITSNTARHLLLQRRSMWSGLQGKLLTGDLARILNVPQEMGVLVELVAHRSLAHYVGLQGGTVRAVIEDNDLVLGGDIILALQGIPVTEEGIEQAQQRMRNLSAGDGIVVKVLRGGEIVELRKKYYPEMLVPPVPADD